MPPFLQKRKFFHSIFSYVLFLSARLPFHVGNTVLQHIYIIAIIWGGRVNPSNPRQELSVVEKGHKNMIYSKM